MQPGLWASMGDVLQSGQNQGLIGFVVVLMVMFPHLVFFGW
jgi:hypothetical protein